VLRRGVGAGGVHVESRWCLRLFQGRSEDECVADGFGRMVNESWDDSDEINECLREQCLFIFRGVE
jgi:hypothetical protein